MIFYILLITINKKRGPLLNAVSTIASKDSKQTFNLFDFSTNCPMKNQTPIYTQSVPIKNDAQCQQKEKTRVNLVNKNCEPIFCSKFRFWRVNGGAICQWKEKGLGSRSQEQIFGVLFLFELFIGEWPSHSRLEIWILSKKWVMGFIYQIHSCPSL